MIREFRRIDKQPIPRTLILTALSAEPLPFAYIFFQVYGSHAGPKKMLWMLTELKGEVEDYPDSIPIQDEGNIISEDVNINHDSSAVYGFPPQGPF